MRWTGLVWVRIIALANPRTASISEQLYRSKKCKITHNPVLLEIELAQSGAAQCGDTRRGATRRGAASAYLKTTIR